jgi:hypothetical protein
MLRTVVENAYGDSTEYEILDMRDPALPILIETVKTPGDLQIFIDTHHAFGMSIDSYYRYPHVDTYYLVRQTNSQVFAIAGYSTNNFVAAAGNLTIGSNMLYRMSAR